MEDGAGTGIRGIYYIPDKGFYRAGIQHKGKRHYETFLTVDECVVYLRELVDKLGIRDTYDNPALWAHEMAKKT